MTNFRLMLLSTAAAGLVAAAVSPASAGEVTKTMAVSGHVNRAIVVSDNGNGTTVGQIDNTYVSGSRVRFVAKAKSESMTIGATTELGLQRNGALSSQANTGTSSLNIRHSYISVSNNMGTLKIGHTSTADDGSISNTLSGTGNAGFYDGSPVGGEVLHVTGDTGTVPGTVNVGSLQPIFDGGRSSNVNYTTPNMNGFSAKAGFSNTDHAAASLHYSGDYNGTKVLATAAYGSRGAAAVDAEYGGSVAVALAGGLNGSLAYSRRSLNSKVAANTGLSDPKMWAGSIGYKMGANGITGTYQNVKDNGANNNKMNAYALMVQHNMSAYGTIVYGGVTKVTYDTTAIKYDDLTAGWVGIKVAF